MRIRTCEMAFVTSAMRGYDRPPRPPSLRGVLIHAKWLNLESIEAPSTCRRRGGGEWERRGGVGVLSVVWVWVWVGA